MARRLSATKVAPMDHIHYNYTCAHAHIPGSLTGTLSPTSAVRLCGRDGVSMTGSSTLRAVPPREPAPEPPRDLLLIPPGDSARSGIPPGKGPRESRVSSLFPRTTPPAPPLLRLARPPGLLPPLPLAFLLPTTRRFLPGSISNSNSPPPSTSMPSPAPRPSTAPRGQCPSARQPAARTARCLR